MIDVGFPGRSATSLGEDFGMNRVNPYEPSGTAAYIPQGVSGPAVGVMRGFLIVLCSGAVGALLGLILGGLLGSVAPDYYRAVFGNPNLNPLQVGAGLGLTQGLGTGIVVGCVVLLAVAISRRRQPAASVQS